MQTVPTVKVVNRDELVEEPLPPRIQEALGQLVGAAKEGLLSLSVAVGLGVLSEMMAEEVEEVCGPKHKHNPDRTAYRHGTDDGTVGLGGGRLEIERPRMRAKDGSGEVPVRICEHFACRDPLQRVVMERMLAGVWTRRFRRTQEPVGEQIEVKGALDVQELDLADVQGAHQARARAADVAVAGRYAAGGDDDRRPGAQGADDDRRARRSRPRASRWRSGFGKATPRTPPSSRRCWRTWSTAALIPSRGCFHD